MSKEVKFEGLVNFFKQTIEHFPDKRVGKNKSQFKHFKTIVYLITGGLDFSKVNLACLPT